MVRLTSFQWQRLGLTNKYTRRTAFYAWFPVKDWELENLCVTLDLELRDRYLFSNLKFYLDNFAKMCVQVVRSPKKDRFKNLP